MPTLDYKMYDIFDELSRDNRWDYLTILILRANKRNRCWPAMRTIAKKAYPGKTKGSAGNLGMATRAKTWLLAHGAITLVKPERRIGAEKKLARNRHVYQLTGVIVIDKKVYPYLYIPGREHVSGDETITDEDVSGGETSGGETSGDETNHLSVESSIISNQESGGDSSSSTIPHPEEVEVLTFSDHEKNLLRYVFGSIAAAKQSLTLNRENTLGWCEYAINKNLLTVPGRRKIDSPPDFVFRMVERKRKVLPLPKLSDEQEIEKDMLLLSDEQRVVKVEKDKAASDKIAVDLVKIVAAEKQAQAEMLKKNRDGINVSDRVTADLLDKWNKYCQSFESYHRIIADMILVDVNGDQMTVVIMPGLDRTSVEFSNFVGGGLCRAVGARPTFLTPKQWEILQTKENENRSGD